MAKLDRDFKIYKKSNDNKKYFLGLFPKDSKSSVKKMELEIDKKGYNVEKVIVEDSFDNWTSYELVNVRTNKGISDSKFDFKIPEGVELVESSGD